MVIRAYGGVKKTANLIQSDYECPINKEQYKLYKWIEWSEDVWVRRGKLINLCSVHGYDDLYEFEICGCIEHDWWIRGLCMLSKSGFEDLINFPYGEGVFGTKVSKKLYYDFVRYHSRAEEYLKALGGIGKLWFDRYYKWEEAFDTARNNGIVILERKKASCIL